MSEPLLNVMVQAARRASRILLRDFNEVEHIRYSVRGSDDFVSASERRVEEVLCEILGEAHPEFDILAEERGFVESRARQRGGGDGARRCWIIDSLDGTRNFTHGFPAFTISLAAQERSEIIAGLIYAPLDDELFTAMKGKGAFLNNRRIRASSCQHVGGALFAYGHMGDYRDKVIALMREGAHMRQLGSVALTLAYVASARLDGFISGETRLWDIAAGMILVREAGGIISTIEGGRRDLEGDGSLLACAGSLHRTITG